MVVGDGDVRGGCVTRWWISVRDGGECEGEAKGVVRFGVRRLLGVGVGVNGVAGGGWRRRDD